MLKTRKDDVVNCQNLLINYSCKLNVKILFIPNIVHFLHYSLTFLRHFSIVSLSFKLIEVPLIDLQGLLLIACLRTLTAS